MFCQSHQELKKHTEENTELSINTWAVNIKQGVMVLFQTNLLAKMK